MNWLMILGTTLLAHMITSSLLIRFLPFYLIPQLNVLWVIVLADRMPTLRNKTFSELASGVLLSACIGHLTDVMLSAPLFLHTGVYTLFYLIQRFVLGRLSTHSSLQGLTVALLAFALSVLLWWVKGLLIGFSMLATFYWWQQSLWAILHGTLFVVLFPALQRAASDANESRYQRLS